MTIRPLDHPGIAPGRSPGKPRASGRALALALATVHALGAPSGASAQSAGGDADPWSPEVEWEWWGSAVEPDSKYVAAAPIVIDLDGDRLPEVVFVSIPGHSNAGMLRVLSGRDGSERFSALDPSIDHFATMSLAAGDLDGDCRPEIVSVLQPGPHPEYTSRSVALRHDGSLAWRSAPHGCRTVDCSPSLADVDHDGLAELSFGSAVLNAGGGLRWQHAEPWEYHAIGLFVDLLAEPGLELVGNARVHAADGRALWAGDGSIARYAAVANFDADPEAEVVRAGRNWIELREPDGRLIWGPMAVVTDTMGSDVDTAVAQPVVADFDGDGEAEIGVSGSGAVAIFEADGRLGWRTASRASRGNGSVAADLDGDGAYELIRSGDNLEIFDGRDGTVRWRVTGPETWRSWTSSFPIVADLDADGRAELLVQYGMKHWSAGTTAIDHPALRVYGSDAWAPARPIWNQQDYHVANVYDDGTLPRTMRPDWAAHNGYRAASAAGPGRSGCRAATPTPTMEPTATVDPTRAAGRRETATAVAPVSGGGGAGGRRVWLPVAWGGEDPGEPQSRIDASAPSSTLLVLPGHPVVDAAHTSCGIRVMRLP